MKSKDTKWFLALALVLAPALAFSAPELLYTTLSHTEGKGIGYKQGYTTLEFFLMGPDVCTMTPFIDIQAHGMNNQRIAINAGVGVRAPITSDWLVGGNLYYDYRQGQHHDYASLGFGFQQLGLGLELLSCWCDVRFNLYQPIGKKTSYFKQVYFNSDTLAPSYVFKRQSAERGWDAELGGTIASGCFADCGWGWSTYLAVGPYYLHPPCGTGRWGGKGRLELYLGRYLFVKGAASYDRANCGTGQICLGIEIPLYPFTSLDSTACCATWGNWMSQPTNRAEIIPLRSRKR